MNKSAGVFLGVFLPTAGVTAGLLLAHQSNAALVAGGVGIVVHWVASAKQQHDGEVADSSYFFGFLLTLIFLAAGLLKFSSAADGQNVFGFLNDLGAGLLLTILGLAVRQVRTLSQPAAAPAEPMDALSNAQRELAAAMRTLVRALEVRPEEVAARELNETRVKAREAVETLERNVSLAAERVDESMRKLEQATTEVTGTLLRSSSGLGESLTTSVERIRIEVAASLSMLEEQRRHVEASVQQAREIYDAAQRGLAGLVAAGTAFHQLADQAVTDVRALPNPADQLTGLWDGVRALETTLASSIGGASQQLVLLTQRSTDLSAALGKLERSTSSAAGSIESGGAELGETLRRELAQMNQVLEDYTRLLERDVVAVGTR